MISPALFQHIDLHAAWTGHHLWEQGQTRRIERQPNAVFWLIRRGRVRVWLDETCLELSEGQAMLQPAGVRREVEALSFAEWRAVGFQARWLRGQDVVNSLPLPLIWNPLEAEFHLLDASLRMLNESNTSKQAGVHLRREGALRLILGYCWAHNRGLTTAALPDWLQQALQVIEHQPRTDLTALARQVGYSPSQFRARFHDQMGMAPRDYALRCLENSIRQLLIETDWPLERIAHQSGFPEATHLVRFFKKRCGITPANFRKQEGL